LVVAVCVYSLTQSNKYLLAWLILSALFWNY
jgi:hypothetical protein